MVNFSDYNAWNHKKQDISFSRPARVFFREREIWWCSIGLNVGCEENGKGELFNRPILILKKYGTESFYGIPISTTKKSGSFYFSININGIKSTCLLTHGRLLDFRRLTQKIITLDEHNFQTIRKAVKDLL